jgi:hypothetical protein
MEDNVKSVATDLFYKVRSRFSGLKLGKETGEVTINPEEAVFFDFDYMEGENPLGHVSVSLAEPGSMKVYYSTGITESMNPLQKNNWYDFLRGLREFAKRRLMTFDTRDITKDYLDKRDFAFLSQYSNNSQVGESVMKEGMYGSSKTSYQKLENTKLIVKHSKQVDENSPGSRTRNIVGLFIENSAGERFKYPFIHLAGARAMQRHVQEGGLPYDPIGKHIVGISEQIAQLKNFNNYVTKNNLITVETINIMDRSKGALDKLREEIQKLSRKSYYEQFKTNFKESSLQEIPEDVIEDLTNKFTVKNFKEDIKSVFPIIYNLMQEENGLGYDDIVAIDLVDQDEPVQEETHEYVSNFDKFESWVFNLGEESAILSTDEDERSAAVTKLGELINQHFPAGTDGTNAIEALNGIIDDPGLNSQIKAAAKQDPDACVRPLVYEWLQQHAPEIVNELDFGDMEQPQESQEEEPEQEEPETTESYTVKDLAEFIGSFYDKEAGAFPKGPEGVSIMVGKKFGERAEQIARKMVERMAPQQTHEKNPQLAELSRIKSLAGI